MKLKTKYQIILGFTLMAKHLLKKQRDLLCDIKFEQKLRM